MSAKLASPPSPQVQLFRQVGFSLPTGSGVQASCVKNEEIYTLLTSLNNKKYIFKCHDEDPDMFYAESDPAFFPNADTECFCF